MNTNMIINLITKKGKGQYFKLSYISDVPVTALAKKNGHIVLKYTSGTFRWGIKYKNIKAVQNRPEFKADANHELPWGEWSAEYPDLVINHKGKSYIRLYTSPNKNKSTYYLDGRPISKEDLQKLGLVINSYWNKNSDSQVCITVKAENIQDIF